MLIRDIFIKKSDISRTDLVNIIAFALSMSKEELFINAGVEICNGERNKIEQLVEMRQRGIPLAYILKEKEFFSEKFFVDERVLIPRPETETLVEEALKLIGTRRDRLLLLDVGTGAGTIGLTIAKKTMQRVVCLDISLDALAVAKKNAMLLDVDEKVCFVCSDLLAGFREGAGFDMILVNLPYIASGEWGSSMPDVRDFEPHIALDGGEGGIEIYRRLMMALPHHLKKGGSVLCEIGSAAQAEDIRNALICLGLRVETKPDLSGRKRVVIGTCINL